MLGDSVDTYLNTNYMLGEYLGFGGITTFATACMEEIRLGAETGGYTTKGFLSNFDRALYADTLYDSTLDTWQNADLVKIINNGVHILNHLGHSDNTNNMKLTNGDVDTLTNEKYCIVYTQGCYAASFDNNDPNGAHLNGACIAQHFTSGKNGAVAFIGNSRFGWGYSDYTAGPSQLYNRLFWDALFNQDIRQLGRMNQDSKEDAVNLNFLFDHNYRYCSYELNLFGDPALEVHVPNDTIVDLRSFKFTEPAGSGVFVPDEEVDLTVNLTAFNKDVADCSISLSTDDPYVAIQQKDVHLGFIVKGTTIDNAPNPLKFKILPSCPLPHRINVTLTIDADGFHKEKVLSLEMPDPRERRITNDSSTHIFPGISGKRIVWCDNRNRGKGDYTGWDIYMYDLSTDTTQKITAVSEDTDQILPFISGNRIIWQDYRDDPYGWGDIYLYDLTTKTERRITSTSSVGLWLGFETSPAISGNYIVWGDMRDDDHSSIYMYDLSSNTERRITSDTYTERMIIPQTSSSPFLPAISGNRIVWVDDRNWLNDGSTAWDIYMRDLSTGATRRITHTGLPKEFDHWFPAISGNYIVWMDSRNGEWDIYMHDLSATITRQITTDKSGQYLPAISGNRIVWQDYRNGNGDIYMYDLSRQIESKVVTFPSEQSRPKISGNYIVWEDNRNGNWDIYVYNFIPDTAPPAGYVKINNGTAATNSVSVTLSLSATDTASGMGVGAGMRFSNDNVTWSGFYPYAKSKTWTLAPGGDGPRMVYVKFMDAAGNWSKAYSAQITLDTVSPTGSIEINRGAAITNAAAVTLALSAQDSGGQAKLKMQFSNDAKTWSALEPYVTTKAWVLAPVSGKKTVYVRFVDLAGNSATYSRNIFFTVARIISPVAGKKFYSTYQAFFWEADPAAKRYVLQIGKSPRSGDIYSKELIVLSAGVHGIILDGKPAYVRFGVMIDGQWAYQEYAYETVDAGSIISPASGSILNSSTVTFQLRPGQQVRDYYIHVGTRLYLADIASIHLLNSAAPTFTVNNILLNGKPVYIKIYSTYAYDTNRATGTYMYETSTPVPVPPNAPTNLTATADSYSQVFLSWIDNSGKETGFKIERSLSVSGPFAQIASVGANVTTYTNSGLAANTAYYYRVLAYNAAGNSGYSNVICVTTPRNPNAPLAPTNLFAESFLPSVVGLRWTDNARNEAGFKIERSTSRDGPFILITILPVNANACYDTRLTGSTTYHYRVCAYNSTGNSEYTSVVSVTTPAS